MGIWSSVGNEQSELRPIPRQVVATVVHCGLEQPMDLVSNRVRHDDLPQTSEMTSVVKWILLCVSLPAPGFLGKNYQILPRTLASSAA